jgi:hypothetical protein
MYNITNTISNIQLRYFITKISERSPNEKVVPEHSLFRIVQDRSGSFRIVQDRSGSFRIVQDRSGSFVIVRDRSWSFVIVQSIFFYLIILMSIYFCKHSNSYSICMYLFLHIRLRFAPLELFLFAFLWYKALCLISINIWIRLCNDIHELNDILNRSTPSPHDSNP